MLFHPRPFSSALSVACCAAIVYVSLALPAQAQQAPMPAKAASDAAAIERSQRQSDNVYRWIKYFADQPKRADATKPRPKTDAPVIVKKSEPKVPVAGAESSDAAVTTPDAAPSPSANANAPPPEAVSSLPVAAVSVATATAEPEVSAETVVPLVPISVVEPTIPSELRRTPIQAKVLVSFNVKKDGTIAAPTVISSNNRRLNRSAIDAISQWRFEPIDNDRTTMIEFQFSQE